MELDSLNFLQDYFEWSLHKFNEKHSFVSSMKNVLTLLVLPLFFLSYVSERKISEKGHENRTGWWVRKGKSRREHHAACPSFEYPWISLYIKKVGFSKGKLWVLFKGSHTAKPFTWICSTNQAKLVNSTWHLVLFLVLPLSRFQVMNWGNKTWYENSADYQLVTSWSQELSPVLIL